MRIARRPARMSRCFRIGLLSPRPPGPCLAPAPRRDSSIAPWGRTDVGEAHFEPDPTEGHELGGGVVLGQRQVRLRLGRRYWPIVRTSISAARSKPMASTSSFHVSPRPTIRPVLVVIG